MAGKDDPKLPDFTHIIKYKLNYLKIVQFFPIRPVQTRKFVVLQPIGKGVIWGSLGKEVTFGRGHSVNFRTTLKVVCQKQALENSFSKS